MNGPEHYREAERLLDRYAAGMAEIESVIAGHADGVGASATVRQQIGLTNLLLKQAQVHGTLALAAAQALQPVAHFRGDDPAVTEWARVIGHQQGAAHDEALR